MGIGGGWLGIVGGLGREGFAGVWSWLGGWWMLGEGLRRLGRNHGVVLLDLRWLLFRELGFLNSLDGH